MGKAKCLGGKAKCVDAFAKFLDAKAKCVGAFAKFVGAEAKCVGAFAKFVGKAKCGNRFQLQTEMEFAYKWLQMYGIDILCLPQF